VLALMSRGPLLAAMALVAVLHGAVVWGLSAIPTTVPITPVAPQSAMLVRVVHAAAMAPEAASKTPPAPMADTPPAAFEMKAAAPPTVDPRAPEFLSTDEVDEPARPLTAWALDAEALSSLGVARIEFDTWVDAQATLVALRVVSVEPASAEGLAPLLGARLESTAMVAARKDGQSVAHQQRIDLGWER
jgi:hypothetical protein